MKEWVDEKIDNLYPLIGRVTPNDFLFEPTNEFYQKLERIELIPPLDEVLQSTEEIAKHIGRSIPRMEFTPFKHNTYGPNFAGMIKVG